MSPAEPRVRVPRPLSRPVRAALLGVLAVAVVAGALAIRDAEATDGGHFDGDRWLEEPQPPRSGHVDSFGSSDPLAGTEGFGPWRLEAGSFAARDGVLEATATGESVAVVDPGAVEVVVFARVDEAGDGDGLVLGEVGGDRLDLVGTDRPGRWVVRIGGTVVVGFDAPTEHVTVQVRRRQSTLAITFDDRGPRDVALPGAGLTGTQVGVVGVGGGLALDLFAYLPLG